MQNLPIATIMSKERECHAGQFYFLSVRRDFRFMDPDATLMIHDVSSMEHGKVEEIKSSAEETERLNQKVYTIDGSKLR